jgi:hypothetical protein
MGAAGLFVSPHAIRRYQERVADVSDDEAYEALSSRAVVCAAQFGAHYVKLSGGQRVVVDGGSVVTVLPANPHGAMNRTGKNYFGRQGQ